MVCCTFLMVCDTFFDGFGFFLMVLVCFLMVLESFFDVFSRISVVFE